MLYKYRIKIQNYAIQIKTRIKYCVKCKKKQEKALKTLINSQYNNLREAFLIWLGQTQLGKVENIQNDQKQLLIFEIERIITEEGISLPK